MCDCATQLEAKLTERFQAQAPNARDHKVKLQGYGIVIQNNAMVMRGFMPYETFARVPLKKGGEKPQKTKGSMFFSFCPFCGEKVGTAPQATQQEKTR